MPYLPYDAAKMPPPSSTRAYYDRFAAAYERERLHGYHRLVDDLEIELVRRYGAGLDVLEAGCGTGLLLRQTARSARRAMGIDLSAGMLKMAGVRNLAVAQGSLVDLPVRSASVDLVYCMKVLPHVAEVESAIAEIARVVRPGGHVLLEFYNPISLRYVAKRLVGPAAVAPDTTESHVFLRYDTPAQARRYLPPSLETIGVRGVRIFTPSAHVFTFPAIARAFSWAERAACDLPLLRGLGGFIILIARRKP